MTTVRNEQLIAKRRNLNLTQQEVANAVGISYRFYQNLEYGKFAPNVETAISIAKLLKCEVRDLFDNPRRQPGDDETQPDYSNSNSDGVEEVKELESAANDFDLDVDSILDIAEDGRLDEPNRREIALRLVKALGKVLEGAA